MPSKKALALCPELIFVRPRFAAYQEVSEKIREIFRRFTEIIEPLSLDEAYLDVTVDKQGIGSAIEIAKRIKQEIRSELQLTASAGVSVNKFVAKIASDMNKPDGLTFIGPSKIEGFVENLPVEKFFGVGKVTATKMKNLNLHSGADLKKLSESEMVKHFGKAGRFYHQIAQGIDERPVQPNRETKSLAAEDTFDQDLSSFEDLSFELEKIAKTLYNRLSRHGLKGRTITLKIKFSDFKQITRSRSFPEPIDELPTICKLALELLHAADLANKKVRLLGISLSNFNPGSTRQGGPNSAQLELF
jgi:DNA polymerase IV